MTLSNQDRALRCELAITAYSDDDAYTNLVDFLADAMHWCQLHGHAFSDAHGTALMHFEAEMIGGDLACSDKSIDTKSELIHHQMTTPDIS